MHYSAEDFAVDSSYPVLISKNANYQQTMGSRVAPSFIDVQMMNQLYGCGNRRFVSSFLPFLSSKTACPGDAQIICLNGGYRYPKNCDQCRCPSGYGGDTCADRQQSSNGTNTCGASLTATLAYTKVSAKVGSDQLSPVPDFTICYWHIDVQVLIFIIESIRFPIELLYAFFVAVTGWYSNRNSIRFCRSCMLVWLFLRWR